MTRQFQRLRPPDLWECQIARNTDRFCSHECEGENCAVGFPVGVVAVELARPAKHFFHAGSDGTA